MTTTLRKIILGVLIAAVALVALAAAALPLTSAFAAGSKDSATPPAPDIVKARLEMAFASQQMRITRISAAVTNYDLLTKNMQRLLDRAKSNGKDVSAIQTAFDAYQAAFEKGRPLYEQAKTIAAAHTGFDTAGNVTDAEQAKATVKSLAGVLRPYGETVGTAFKALHQAIQAFRLANPRSAPSSTPASGF